MGACLLLYMKKGECQRLRRVLTQESYRCPEIPVLKKGYEPYCWPIWRGRLLELEHQSGFGNSEWSRAIGLEIFRRFGVEKVGWDSVGYYDDAAKFGTTRPFDLDIKWHPQWKPMLVESRHIMQQAAKELLESVPILGHS